MMKISARCEYAIHSLVYFKLHEKKERIDLSEVARIQGISQSYLAKILSELAKAGLMESFRGVGGGYCLAQDRQPITLKDIVVAMEGEDLPFRDEWQTRNCSSAYLHTCSIRNAFYRAYQRMLEELSYVTLEDLATHLVSGNPPQWVGAVRKTGILS